MPMIDLGHEMSITNGPPEDAKVPDKVYPTIYIEGKDLKDLPEEGKAIISFRVTRDTKDRIKGTREVVLEVRSIGDYKAPEDAGEELDKLRYEVEED